MRCYTLTPALVQSAGQGDHTDGGGLLLRVREGSASWVFRYTSVAGQRREMGLGGVVRTTIQQAQTSIETARAEADKWRSIRLRGGDPIDEREDQRQQAKVSRLRAKGMTVLRVLRLWMDATDREKNWSHKYRVNMIHNLEQDPPKWFLAMPFVDAHGEHVVRALGEMTCSQSTKDKFRQRFDWASEWMMYRGESPANPGAVRRVVRGRFGPALEMQSSAPQPQHAPVPRLLGSF